MCMDTNGAVGPFIGRTELELAKIPSALEAHLLAYKADTERKLSEAAKVEATLELLNKQLQDYYAQVKPSTIEQELKAANALIKALRLTISGSVWGDLPAMLPDGSMYAGGTLR